MSDINLNKLFRQSRRICKSDDSDFKEQAEVIIDKLYIAEKSPKWAEAIGEIIPRIFARDVNTGYALFHKKDVLKKIWELYTRSSKINVENQGYPPWQKKNKRHKVACLTGIFFDGIAPTKAIVDFALNLDTSIFEPVVISTNQFFTHGRRIGREVPDATNTFIGHHLAYAGIEIISLEACNSNTELAHNLINKCHENAIDMVVSNASAFSFPEACLAASGVVKSFFNMHRGFPLYSGNIDAICHFIPETRKTQLGLWEEEGGKVIEYDTGIDVQVLPPKPDNGDVVYFITVSNHLVDRLNPEFCEFITGILLDHPQVRYTLLGEAEPNALRDKFPENVRHQIECPGPQNEPAKILGWLRSSDIYINEFPVGGGRALLEAMNAELPVIAMRCGSSHVENIGATIVGPTAIQEFSVNKYKELLVKLITDKDKRIALGKSLRERVENVFDVRKTVKDLSEEILKIHLSK